MRTIARIIMYVMTALTIGLAVGHSAFADTGGPGVTEPSVHATAR